jgi:hypothetical protein
MCLSKSVISGFCASVFSALGSLTAIVSAITSFAKKFFYPKAIDKFFFNL